MKSFLRIGGGFLVLLYVAGIALSAYRAFQMPELLSRSNMLDMTEVKRLMPLMNETFMIVGASMVAGLLAIIFLMVSRSSATEEQVQIANIGSKNKKTGAQETEEEDTSILRLAAAEQALNDSGELKNKLNAILAGVCNELEASQGAIYEAKTEEGKRIIELSASYAYSLPDSQTIRFEFGEGLAGQAAKEGRLVNIQSVPEGYVQILSGLGSATPSHLIIVPLIHEEKVYGVAEIASFKAFGKKEEKALQFIFAKVAKVLSDVNVLEPSQAAE